MQKLSPIMFAGTGSDVGKSVIATAFCRIFFQDGYTPAPFKAQNMANNSYVTEEGLEISRAQAVQAEAAGIPCHTDMNPLVLKPISEKICHVILNGKAVGNKSAYEYFKTEGRNELRDVVHSAFDRLSARFNPIVMEGAGSISEINLRAVDLVNMPMAIHANAPVILVADIDRGGVFASVYGSVMLLTPEERKHLKGILINKFRGDMRLFESGVTMLEELCGIPVIGVVPYFQDIHVEEEDALHLEKKPVEAALGVVNIAVVLLRHLSNFTDFNQLEQDPRVHLYYSNNPHEIEKADIVIIPSSENILSDLYQLRQNGLAKSIVHAHQTGATILGIGAGFQMMGEVVHNYEGNCDAIQSLPGLGLLPITTELFPENKKITRQVEFTFLDQQNISKGYEIQSGAITISETSPARPVNRLTDQTIEGYFLNERCLGTNIHGFFDNAEIVDYLLKAHSDQLTARPFDLATFKNEQYERLAAHVRAHVDMDLVYKIMHDGV